MGRSSVEKEGKMRGDDEASDIKPAFALLGTDFGHQKNCPNFSNSMSVGDLYVPAQMNGNLEH